MTLPVGTVVKARYPIVDVAKDGEHYFHATPADPWGVIIHVLSDDESYTVAWSLRGACDVHESDLEVHEGYVVHAVGQTEYEGQKWREPRDRPMYLAGADKTELFLLRALVNDHLDILEHEGYPQVDQERCRVLLDKIDAQYKERT